jgi:16S rRNA (guanine966-N2)-methyltransferase
MRIIAGEKRGTKLVPPNDNRIRPTADRVKEALFGSIQFIVLDATVLDLFAGSGSLGLEAVSRGAKQVFLVDKNTDAINTIHRNISRLGCPLNIKIIKNDYRKAIRLFQNRVKFDIVFIDPPYESCLYRNAVEVLVESGVLLPQALLILESFGEIYLDVDGIVHYKTKKIGDTYLNFYRYERTT